MRKIFSFTLVLLCVTALSEAAVAETIYIVKISDYTGDETVELMTSEKLNTTREEIKKEQQVFQKALTRASQTWQEDPEKKNVMFPRSGLHPKRVDIVRWFTDPVRANAELANQKKLEKQDRKRDQESENGGILQEAVQVLKGAIKQELKALEKEEREKKREEEKQGKEAKKSSAKDNKSRNAVQ